jgi:hypothetical protein
VLSAITRVRDFVNEEAGGGSDVDMNMVQCSRAVARSRLIFFGSISYAATSRTTSGLAKQTDRVELAAEFTDPVIDGEPVRTWGGFTFASGDEGLCHAVNGALAEFKKTDDWAEIGKSYGFTQADLDGSTKHTTE